ncbi:glutathione peroxidase [Dyadobacter sp. CY326]|uniref:glutathione peroxidase n=1 Tax=Dyadobacter sp. CY326 TaxID=2907300 RepID=UPI001F1B4F17|nr:glutathione peroxidase [Dyadobacter sp. CY326]MCE7064346.1 glutathione peroxidase [Dyadobacter sp. CY326]
MSFLKTLFIMITSLITGLFADKSEVAKKPDFDVVAKQSLYDFKVKSLVGNKTVDLSKYKGKKVVILNVASKCGYTKQYADWEKFNKEHGDKVVVLGFPANNFGGQEPGTSEEIATFCSATYGVTFPMFEKVSVVGDDQAPIYKWLTSKHLNGWNDKAPTWNFCKYVVNEKGELTNFFASKILPTDPEFLTAVGI